MANYDNGLNPNIFDTLNRLIRFLNDVNEEASNIKDVSKQNAIIKSSLEDVRDIINLILINYRNTDYYFNINHNVHINKKNVPSFFTLCQKVKKSWLELISSLIPVLENEWQMSFLNTNDTALDLADFIIDNIDESKLNLNEETNGVSICIKIISNSFLNAKMQNKAVVELDDVIKAVNNCPSLGKRERMKLGTNILNKWYLYNDNSTYKKHNV